VTEPLVYLNGKMVPASLARLNIYDAGIVLGATVSEQTRTFRKKLFRLDDHLDRLFRSLRIAGMEIGTSKEELAQTSRELVAHNAAALEDWDDLGLCHFVTAGEIPTYAGGQAVRSTPTICAHTYPLPFDQWAEKIQFGIHLITPTIRQVPPECVDPQMKCRSRMHYYLADREAHMTDPEASALLLDVDGNVTETSTANFLLVENGTIISPSASNTLPGISRAMVIELAGRLEIPFVERHLQVSDIIRANEAFLSSTGFCLMPVTRLNFAPIADGKPGPIFRRVIDAWAQEVGIDIERQIVDGARTPRRSI
jgi:branched-subunit amino acid aminotransferase/4-amino-4-deoxychorismate lyase